MLTFSAPEHRYEWNGSPVPSVTQVIGEFISIGVVYISTFTGVRILSETMESARDFGTAVHRMIALDISGELDEDALDPALVPVLAQWQKLCAAVRPEVLLSETPLYCSAMNYAGTPDIVCKIRGVLSIIDCKTGMMGMCGPQTAAYEIPVREYLKTRARFDRYGLRLPKDGGQPKLIKYSDRNDFAFFQSRLFQWRYLSNAK
jgi:hypothetical protein